MSETLSGGYAIELWRAEGSTANRAAKLLGDIWAELAQDPLLDASAITVEADDGGAAILSGAVSTYPQKLAAFRTASRVSGVARVSNDITVQLAPAHERTDARLARIAQRALEWNVRVPGGRIAVTVTGGVVQLDGQVDRDGDRRAAEEAVEQLIGVRGVASRITLRPAALPRHADARVGESLRRALGSEAKHVKVSVRGDALALHGHVRTLSQRADAERAAFAVPGVMRVENQLRLSP